MNRFGMTALLALAASIVATAAMGQTNLVSWDFNSGAAPWIVTNNSSAPTTNREWLNSAGNYLSPSSGDIQDFDGTNFMLVDADSYGLTGQTIDTTCTSPTFDGTAAPGTLYLRFEQAHSIWQAESMSVEIFNGTTWTQLQLFTVSTSPGQGVWQPSTVTVDVTAHKNAANQVRIRYQDPGSWGWMAAFDNVSLFYYSGPEIAPAISAIDIETGHIEYLGLRTQGQAFNQVIIVNNPGTAALNHTATVVPTPVNCSVTITSPLAASTSAGGVSNMIIEITPTGFGVWSAQISIDNDDTTGSEDPFLINFQGVCLGNTQRFYAGDFDGSGGVVAGAGFTSPIDSWCWEELNVPAGETWTVTHVYANFLGNDISTITQVDFEVRTGMAIATAGTLVESGTVTGTAARHGTELNFPGFPPMFEFTAYAQLSTTFNLTAGTYYLGVRPRTTATGTTICFCSSTAGTNGVGAPLTNQFAIWHDVNGQYGATPYEQADISGSGSTPTDHSIGCSGSVTTGTTPVIDITTTTLPNAVEAVAYNTGVTATQSGTTGPYTWALVGAPAGMTITGTTLNATINWPSPTATGSPFNFSITVTAASSQTDSQAVTLTVLPAGTLIITTTTLAGGTVGSSFSRNITCTGGTGPYTWSVASGTLPTGVTLQPSTTTTVVISGTPTVASTFNFTIQVTDSTAGTPQTDTQVLSVTISAASGGPGGGGGGGGGGGCAAETGTPWAALLGLLALASIAMMLRRRTA